MASRGNQIRIIAGEWRSRKLPVIDQPGLRPTTDRVRETLFNWLMHDVREAVCLDLFAGSGALGLECLSRGAAKVEFVDQNRQVTASLSKLLTQLGADDRATITTADAQHFLAQPVHQTFDLVFLDPPFASDALTKTAMTLQQRGWLHEASKVYVEQSARQAEHDVPDAWRELRSGRAGESHFSLYSCS